jgi:hypothetical protein
LSSIWDEKPYELLEEDVVTFLDPPKELIPLDPDTYNPAAYLWLVSVKALSFTLPATCCCSLLTGDLILNCRSKIEDIPEERRLRLLSLIKQPR